MPAFSLTKSKGLEALGSGMSPGMEDFGFWILDFGLRSRDGDDFGFRISDFGLPKSVAAKSSTRRANTV
jgi:hypothetical protein